MDQRRETTTPISGPTREGRAPGGHRMKTRILLAAGLLAAVAACKARPSEEGRPQCPSWKGDVSALLAQRCASCHSGTRPAGSFDATTYGGVLANGADGQPLAVAGDAASPLVKALESPAHTSITDVAQVRGTLEQWVGECRLTYSDTPVHTAGLLDPSADDFHGALLARSAWDFDECGQCHGADLKGGSSGASCYGCHEAGPTSCDTCHGRHGRGGAHAVHLVGGTHAAGLECAECHVTPQNWKDPGHLFDADGRPLQGAVTVTLGARAALTRPGATRAGAPTYNPADKSCSNVYCHGGGLRPGGTATAPRWTDEGALGCGACHGMPPAGHGGTVATCAACHQDVIATNGEFSAPARHVDGELQARGTACNACHGSAETPAPPTGLQGQSSPADLGVGAHRAHVLGRLKLRGPIACGECHVNVTEVLSPGHIDGATERVFPAGWGAGTVAAAGGASPEWDPATARCSSVHCHGGGTAMAGDTAATLREPVWTQVGGDQTVCGTCHGAPPADGRHAASLKLKDCATCHGDTLNEWGDFLFEGAPGAETSKHINGVVDVDN